MEKTAVGITYLWSIKEFPTFIRLEGKHGEYEVYTPERTCQLISHEVFELPDSLKDVDFEMHVYKCSECGEPMFSNYNYCPNCGGRVMA